MIDILNLKCCPNCKATLNKRTTWNFAGCLCKFYITIYFSTIDNATITRSTFHLSDYEIENYYDEQNSFRTKLTRIGKNGTPLKDLLYLDLIDWNFESIESLSEQLKLVLTFV